MVLIPMLSLVLEAAVSITRVHKFEVSYIYPPHHLPVTRFNTVEAPWEPGKYMSSVSMFRRLHCLVRDSLLSIA